VENDESLRLLPENLDYLLVNRMNFVGKCHHLVSISNESENVMLNKNNEI